MSLQLSHDFSFLNSMKSKTRHDHQIKFYDKIRQIKKVSSLLLLVFILHFNPYTYLAFMLGANHLVPGGHPYLAISACKTEFITWYLRHPEKGIPTESSSFCDGHT